MNKKNILGILMLFAIFAIALPIGMADENSNTLHEGMNVVLADQNIKPDEWAWKQELKYNLIITKIELYNPNPDEYEIYYAEPVSEQHNTLKIMRNGESYHIYTALPKAGSSPHIEKYFNISNFRIHTLALRGGNQQAFDILVPGTGSSSNMSFFTHENTYENRSMAQFLADNHRLVVGIDYPYVIQPYSESNDYSYLASMDTAQHTQMIKHTIDYIQNIIGKKDHKIIAHSFGGFPASDYASRYTDRKLNGLILLDTAGPLNNTTQPELVQAMLNNYNSTLAAIAASETKNLEMVYFAQISATAENDPNGDSWVTNPEVPGTNLTNLEYFMSALQYTSMIPGSEIYMQGMFAGDQTPIETIYQAAAQGTIYPMAISADMYGIHGKVPGSFQINYGSVKVPVKVINFELGMGSNGDELAREIIAGGNNNVCRIIIPGYSHGDGIYGTNAEQDVWQPMIQPTC